MLVPKPESVSNGAAAQLCHILVPLKMLFFLFKKDTGCKITMFMNILFGKVPEMNV